MFLLFKLITAALGESPIAEIGWCRGLSCTHVAGMRPKAPASLSNARLRKLPLSVVAALCYVSAAHAQVTILSTDRRVGLGENPPLFEQQMASGSGPWSATSTRSGDYGIFLSSITSNAEPSQIQFVLETGQSLVRPPPFQNSGASMIARFAVSSPIFYSFSASAYFQRTNDDIAANWPADHASVYLTRIGDPSTTLWSSATAGLLNDTHVQHDNIVLEPGEYLLEGVAFVQALCCAGSEPAANAHASLVFGPCTTVLSNPDWFTKCPGEEATFTFAVEGVESLAYRWNHNDLPVLDGATSSGSMVSGTTTRSLRVQTLAPQDSGYYICYVSSPIGLCTGAEQFAPKAICRCETEIRQPPCTPPRRSRVSPNLPVSRLAAPPRFNISALTSCLGKFEWYWRDAAVI